jgi:DNA-directed RNA polymerase subunit RPC12/RpoP
MPVKVRCSSCDKVVTVPDSARGKAVKCPQCETRIAVPSSDSGAQKAIKDSGAQKAVKDSGAQRTVKKKPSAAKSSQPIDSEDALASLDLRRVEDTNARICPKCGFDMQELDEEETECPKCGFDVEEGGLGIKARKRALKGPDPADFYPGLAGGAWKFVMKNQMLAWRTAIYTLVCTLISLLCVFMYLWISAWPPRAFFALCFSVAFLVIPGWLWYLDCEVIKLTLERKDKFKKLNFDFFLASSKGVMSVAWAVAVAAPILAIPGGIGYFMVFHNGQPEWVLAVCLGIGSIPLMWMLPVVMSHMTMPIPLPGWMFWKVIEFWFRTIGGCSVWMMWFLISSIPVIAGAATIGAVWGNDITTIVNTMESNADISRRILAAENAPKPKKGDPIAPPVDIAAIGKPADVDFKPLIGPVIVLLVMCLPVGFIGLFNMRINGQFTFYFRERLDLIDKAKEYKYVAKKRKSADDDDDAPATLQKDLTDGLVIAIAFALVGAIGGYAYGFFSSAGMTKGIVFGLLIGCTLGLLFALIRLIVVASDGGGFTWERTRKLVFEMITAAVIVIIAVVVFVSQGETFTLPS